MSGLCRFWFFSLSLMFVKKRSLRIVILKARFGLTQIPRRMNLPHNMQNNLKVKRLFFSALSVGALRPLAFRVDSIIESSEVVASYNLTGCVFSWTNQERSLFDQSLEPTTKVHPYNFYTGRLIKDRKAISYKP